MTLVGGASFPKRANDRLPFSFVDRLTGHKLKIFKKHRRGARYE
jgi:hypothetical protein